MVITLNLPEKFVENMRRVLMHYEDGESFFDEIQKPPFRGIRLNPLKCTREKLLSHIAVTGESPFCKEAFYIDGEQRIGLDVYHHAGAFYVQEPSAGSAVELLEIEPDDVVLDLCAAPGGKSTQIAAKLGENGVIWSNDAVFRRAQIIVSNFERMGVANGIVSSAMPDALAKSLGGAFDKILVDAPCSGEGMFRKEPQALSQWSVENVAACAERQLEILNSAAEMLRDGGTLVYSTCTFSLEENENNVKRFLEAHPEFEAYAVNESAARRAIGLENALRVLPMDGGEGHFVARFKKRGNAERTPLPCEKSEISAIHKKALDEFCEKNGVVLPNGTLLSVGDTIYLSPVGALPKGLGIIRQGLQIGGERKGRLQPSHAMFASPAVKTQNNIMLSADSPETAAFLHGEEIAAEGFSGYCRVCVDGIPLSFGKASGARLKNGYPKGLRSLVK